MRAFIAWNGVPLTDSLVRNALKSLQVVPDIDIIQSPSVQGGKKLLQWATYDELDHELTYVHRDEVLSSAYTFRKGLIRKHFLSRAITQYLTKNSGSVLSKATPKTYEIELSFADELSELFSDELWELGQQLAEDPSKWWILKPSMADRGNGIRIFNSRAALEQIFIDFEDNEDDAEDNTVIITSQLRHFVVQEYIMKPLLMDPSECPINGASKPTSFRGYKFHLRVYCLASGALTLFVYDRILALFSAVPYILPLSNADSTEHGQSIDLAPHLTNTSLQVHRGEEGVRLLDELVGCHILPNGAILTEQNVKDIISQVGDIMADTCKAALGIHFQASQAIDNAYELFGVDFILTEDLQLMLLEINAEPAIELTGPRCTWILEDLFTAIAKVCVGPFFQNESQSATEDWKVGETRYNLKKCLNMEVRGNA